MMLLAVVVVVEVGTVGVVVVLVVVVVVFVLVVSLNILLEERLGSVLPNKLEKKGFSLLCGMRCKSNVIINMNLILF